MYSEINTAWEEEEVGSKFASVLGAKHKASPWSYLWTSRNCKKLPRKLWECLDFLEPWNSTWRTGWQERIKTHPVACFYDIYKHNHWPLSLLEVSWLSFEDLHVSNSHRKEPEVLYCNRGASAFAEIEEYNSSFCMSDSLGPHLGLPLALTSVFWRPRSQAAEMEKRERAPLALTIERQEH